MRLYILYTTAETYFSPFFYSTSISNTCRDGILFVQCICPLIRNYFFLHFPQESYSSQHVGSITWNKNLKKLHAANRFEPTTFRFATLPIELPEHGNANYTVRLLYEFTKASKLLQQIWSVGKAVGRFGLVFKTFSLCKVAFKELFCCDKQLDREKLIQNRSAAKKQPWCAVHDYLGCVSITSSALYLLRNKFHSNHLLHFNTTIRIDGTPLSRRLRRSAVIYKLGTGTHLLKTAIVVQYEHLYIS